MRTVFLMTSAAISALALTACSQEPVQVSQKGHMFYGVGDGNSYSPPRLHSYHPTPYEPDFRVGNGKVAIGNPATPAANTYSYSAASYTETPMTAPIQSVEVAPIQQEWAPIQPMTTASPNHTFTPPVDAQVVSSYGKRPNGSANDGINYLLPAGEPVFASASGKVAYVGDELQSYGRMVIIKHDNGYNTSYAHLSRATVEKMDVIRQGQIIGYVGQTGNVDKPQLHFAIRKGSDPVDPNTLLSKQLASY